MIVSLNIGFKHCQRMREVNSTLIRLNSDPSNVEKVSTFVETLANKFRFAPDTYGNILISLTEAVNNAIIHGNCRDQNKVVEVRTSKRKGRLAITVKDEGDGFDYSNLPDPTCSERVQKCGGRGVFLMRQLSDRCSFQDNGRIVEMQFKL